MTDGYSLSETARRQFVNLGLTYDDLNISVLHVLYGEIAKELVKGGIHDRCLKMTMGQVLVDKSRNGYYLTINGYYFKNREAVSFNPGGFIGFAGWASSDNLRPIIDGFMNWCSWMQDMKKGSE